MKTIMIIASVDVPDDVELDKEELEAVFDSVLYFLPGIESKSKARVSLLPHMMEKVPLAGVAGGVTGGNIVIPNNKPLVVQGRSYGKSAIGFGTLGKVAIPPYMGPLETIDKYEPLSNPPNPKPTNS